jgi:hypothetical protein
MIVTKVNFSISCLKHWLVAKWPTNLGPGEDTRGPVADTLNHRK